MIYRFQEILRLPINLRRESTCTFPLYLYVCNLIKLNYFWFSVIQGYNNSASLFSAHFLASLGKSSRAPTGAEVSTMKNTAVGYKCVEYDWNKCVWSKYEKADIELKQQAVSVRCEDTHIPGSALLIDGSSCRLFCLKICFMWLGC
jgi:hypothetical protein